MAKEQKWLKFGTTTGQPIQVGGRIIVPEAQVVALTTPLGGVVWNRPTAVLLQTAAATERVPILDITRYAQLSLLALSLLVFLLARQRLTK